jgi:hypothetical protein
MDWLGRDHVGTTTDTHATYNSCVFCERSVPTGYKSQEWTNKGCTLKSQHPTLVQQYPEAEEQLKHLFKVLGDIEDVAGHTPASVGAVRNGLPL